MSGAFETYGSNYGETYGALAPYYDRLMTHVDYDAWVDYALKRLGHDEGKGGPDRGVTVLDLACGTGSMAVRMAKRNLKVIGLDASEAMLAVAYDKAETWGVPVFLTCQDMTEFTLDQTVDAAVCLFDSLNYLTEDGDLEQAFICTFQALKPGGLFLFDLHTEARFHEMANDIYVERDDDIAYIWESDYDESTRICTMDLTVFVRHGDKYVRFDEVHEERAYGDDHVQAALKSAGFDLKARFGALSDDPPQVDERRVFYLAQKR